MFFPEKIKNIKKNDYVLEIGPGGTPFNRSDVFLELKYDNEAVFRMQRGNTEKLVTDKPIFYYDGQHFPFSNKEFDYVICSHVLEHVENLPFFLSELFRITDKGYIEYPTILYEYLYNINVHINILKLNDNKLYYIKKNQTKLANFLPIQSFFLQTLENGVNSFINDLKEYMFEGFEWNDPFEYQETKDISKLVWKNFTIHRDQIRDSNFSTKIIKRLFFNDK